MATVIGDNIISPLGFTTDENYQAVRLGKTALRHYDTVEGIPFPFTASLFSKEQINSLRTEGLTKFESLAYQSIIEAIKDIPEVVSNSTVLILSSTTGNVGLLKKKQRTAKTLRI